MVRFWACLHFEEEDEGRRVEAPVGQLEVDERLHGIWANITILIEEEGVDEAEEAV